MDEDEFTAWIGSAIAAMRGVAISISIVGHTAQIKKSTMTHHRLVGASARDAVSILDSLARDKERHGGVWGVSSYTLGQIKKQNGCWFDRTFRPVAGELVSARNRKPKQIMQAIEQMRRESTGHLSIIGKSDAKLLHFNTEDMWQAYGWIKEMLSVWLSRLHPPYQWFDEQAISDAVLRDLSSPIIPRRTATSAS